MTAPAASEAPVVTTSGPVRPAERVLLLDILRGFALLGIAQVNWGGPLSGTLGTLLDLLVTGTFYSMFAILFGVGIAIQFQRAEAGQRPFVLRYLWRTLLLFAIGAAHEIFIWNGDVIAGYAVLGLVLLPFIRLRAPLLLAFAALFLTLSMAPRRWFPDVGLVNVVQPYDSAQAAARRQQADSGRRANARTRSAADSGTAPYWDGVRASASGADLPRRLGNFTRLRGLKGESEFLALFILGLWIGRRRLVENAAIEKRLLLAAGGIGLVLGAAGNAQTVLGAFALPEMLRGWRLAWSLGNISLAVFYMSAIALFVTRTEVGRRVFAPLGWVGRMGLTNYLLQSLVMTTLLYGRFLDLRQSLGDGWLLQLVVNLVFAAQIAFSWWWFTRFRYGPAEWAWRAATWMRAEPLRRERMVA